MNTFLAQTPLLRLMLPFILGIAFAYAFHVEINLALITGALLCCITGLIFHRKLLRRSLRWTGADGLLIFSALFIAALGITSLNMQVPEASPLGKNNVEAISVQLIGEPVVKERSVKLFVEVRAWKDASGWNAADEKLLVYLKREEAAEKLQYGDQLLIAVPPRYVEPPKNPGEFDYRLWLERQGIRGQVYAKNGEWDLTSRGNGNAFKSTALELRRYFLGKLQSYGLDGPSFGVAAALLLGASDHLDPGLMQAYSASGTLHVLSVSGMHVALVYVVLLKLLAPLERRKYGKWISVILQLAFLWFYATLTGLCPSVLRSVTMLSVVIAGRAFNRQAHILNSLAASALILLLGDPLLLFDIGFQLSYLAVAGIVLLQPKLENLWTPRFWITRQLWSLVSVTLVAQVFTFPLGLYYFHQFPTYFVLSNLVVIPLSTLAMYVGLVLLIVSPFAFLAQPVANVFGFLLDLLNGSVMWIERLPSATLHSAGWSKTELLLLYAFIALFLLFLVKKRNMLLRYSLVSLLFLLGFVAAGDNSSLRREELVFFSINRSTAIAVIHGNDHMLFADTGLIRRKGDIDFHIEPFLEENGWRTDKIVPLTDSVLTNAYVRTGQNGMLAGGKKIVLAGRGFELPGTSPGCDILLLRENTFAKLDTLITVLKPGMVVADGSNGMKRITVWKEICAKRGVKFYNVKDDGALIIER